MYFLFNGGILLLKCCIVWLCVIGWICQIHTICSGKVGNHMSHYSLEMKAVILVQSVEKFRIRFHASVGEKSDVQSHAIQILDGCYYTVHVTICGNGLIHGTTEVIMVIFQCLLVES